uniref:Nck-associated protein 1 n=1 Tax=Panagrellus redivivus TaxID=6233 RepID=A0A7E4UN81_PANRE
MNDSHQRIAERLVILNNRCVGLLTRLYNIKKSCATVESRPKVLTSKPFEQAISVIGKKFPHTDLKKHSSAFSNVDEAKGDILKSLSQYYFTFVNLLELKEQVFQQLAIMDANQFLFDISLNFDATTAYLNLVVNFISAMILLSRIEERKSLIGLYNVAHELSRGSPEPKYHRLAQLVVDYDQPLKKLSEDLSSIHRSVTSALESVMPIYERRNISADDQRKSSFLSLLASPAQILFAAQTGTCACEYLSLDLMDRWIILTITVCHSTLLANDNMVKLYNRALRNGVCIRLFRDENLLIFNALQNFYDSIKGCHKRAQDIKDLYNLTLQTCISFHAHRRQFLRNTLRDLCFLIRDQPGLLGPKALFVWMALSLSRDEVYWILRHNQVWPQVIANKKAKELADVGINDKSLPELLFYMVELQNLVLKYSYVISNYHARYIAGYDVLLLEELLPGLSGMSDREAMLVNSVVDELRKIMHEGCDLRGIRLDWFRFQASVSSIHSQFRLRQHREFTEAMNTTVFHTKMVDSIQDMLRDTGDLSVYCFYFAQFDSQLKQSLNLPVQSRYSIAFAHICSHFENALHEYCPEEHEDITERSLSLCNVTLDWLAARTAEVVSRITNDEFILAIKTSPQACANFVIRAHQNATNEDVAGVESYRKNRENVTAADKNYMYLLDLCTAVGYSKEIRTFDHTFAPREYLQTHLETEMVSTLHKYFRGNNDHPRRPTEMLMLLQAQISAIQTLEGCLRFDMTQFLNNVLLQQTQPTDSYGKETLTSQYCRWYLEALLRKASAGQIVYSDHLRLFECPLDVALPFSPERFTDTRELRALAQLISPYGIKFLAERLVWHVASQITELFKLVKEHRDILLVCRGSFDKPDRMRELISQLSVADPKDKKSKEEKGSPIESVLQRVTIIGEIIAFRNLLIDALKDVVDAKLPFLMGSLNGLFQSADPLGKIQMGEMCAAAGIQTEVDVALMKAIQVQAQISEVNDEEHYFLSSLLFVFIAISLPKLATSRASLYVAKKKYSANNCHVVPLAVNTMASALFCHHKQADTQERMREFLALTSSCLLQIIGTPEATEMELHQSIFVLLETLVKDSPWLHYDLLESCFPFTIIRSSYNKCYSNNNE